MQNRHFAEARRIDHFVVGPHTGTAGQRLALWHGPFLSSVRVTGYIVSNWLQHWAGEFDCHFICSQTDYPTTLTPEEVLDVEREHPRFSIPIISPRTGSPPPRRCFQIPPGDDLAELGIRRHFEGVPEFEDRRDTMFWRGGCSGNGLRLRVVEKLLAHPRCDVKLMGRWHHDNGNYAKAPDSCFGAETTIEECLAYKYLLMIDGNSIASNSTWVPASGAVPILVGEWKPFWHDFARPWKDYVPVRLDLADLCENLDRILSSPGEARQIAANARKLALEVMTPERLYQITRANFLKAFDLAFGCRASQRGAGGGAVARAGAPPDAKASPSARRATARSAQPPRSSPGFRVVIHRSTGNLGDAVQTYAMARLLPPPLLGVYRDRAALACAGGPGDVPFVVNAWLGDPAPMDENCFFAGVHLGNRAWEQIAWIRQSRFAVGARDPHTQARLAEAGIASEMVGCATLTLAKYDGPRHGTICIDADGPPDAERLSNSIADVSWPEQWEMAMGLLERLRGAALVVTSRLHVALPCLAMGTPVVVSAECRRQVWQSERFTLLDRLGFRYGEPNVIDVAPAAERFKAFLGEALDIEVNPTDEPAKPMLPLE